MTIFAAFEHAAWLRADDRPNTHTLYRTEWNAEAGEAEIVFALEAAGEIFFNGTLLDAAQASDLPPEKSITRCPVTLKQGPNTLAIRLYNLGIDTFSHIAAPPGIILGVMRDTRAIETSGTHWKTLRDPAFADDTPRVTPQLGFTFRCDARKALPGWEQPGFDDSAWPHAQVVTPPPYQFIPRAVGADAPAPVAASQLVRQGVLFRKYSGDNPAECCMRDLRTPRSAYEITSRKPDPGSSSDRPVFVGPGEEPLRFRDVPPEADGVYAVFDLGGEVEGYLDFAVECVEEGTVIDIAHGEHLDDGSVRACVGERAFADRFIARKGLNSFACRTRRFGARYLECHFTGPGAREAAIRHMTLRESIVPLDPEQPFACSDRLLEAIDRVARRTLTCCMHEHYEDCPWREQGLYAYDSRNQALFGYYVRGNAAFARHSLDLLGRNRFANGLLRLTSPGRYKRTIPMFSLAWIAALHEYTLHTGDRSLAAEHRATVDGILDPVLARLDRATGLAPLARDRSMTLWHFYEWAPGLEGGPDDEQDFSALYNLYCCEALRCAEKLYPGSRPGAAEALGIAVERHFRDESRGCYRSADGTERCHEHTQAMMLYLGLAPLPMRKRIVEHLAAHDLTALTFSALPYLVRALNELDPEGRAFAEQIVRANYEPMVLSGASTFYEAPGGSVEFRGAGSLCHGWSALGTYYCRHTVLGVEPLTPGYARFRVRPAAGTLTRAEGCVPTPAGPIRVAWRREAGKLRCRVDYPKTLQCESASHPEFPTEFILNPE